VIKKETTDDYSPRHKALAYYIGKDD